MSDLSELPAFAGSPDGAEGHYAWPTPELAGYPAAETAGQALDCVIEGLNGHQQGGQLSRFDPEHDTLLMRQPPPRKPLRLALHQFRRLQLTRPLRALAPRELGRVRGDMLAPAQPFRVEFKDASVWEGQTIGQREEPWGLFLFEPIDDQGTVRRWFVPRPVYTQARIGLRIGEALVQQHSATPEEIRVALAEQEALRSRKIGEVLVVRKIITREALAKAIEHQSRMPMVRIGQALEDLGLISPTQLQEALAQQRRDRSLPLGELLVRKGAVSRTELQMALARKMGYPLVDVQQFAPDEQALARLPQALAARLCALPLMQLAGRLIVALEDPTDRRLQAELEFAARCKIVPVLAPASVLIGAIDRAYDQLGPPGSPTAPFESLGGILGLHAWPELSDPAMAKLIEPVIEAARAQGIDRVHIECSPGGERVRVRIHEGPAAGLFGTA